MNKKFKTIGAAALAAAMCIYLAGCGEKATVTSSPSKSVQSANQSKPESKIQSVIGSGKTSSASNSGSVSNSGSAPENQAANIPDVPLSDLPLVPPVGATLDDGTPLNIIKINNEQIDLLKVNPKEFCQKAPNFLMQIDDNHNNTKMYKNKAGFLFNGVPVAQGFNGSAPVYIETLDANGDLLTEWRLDTDPDNPLPYDDYEIKGIYYEMPFGRNLNISFIDGLIDMGQIRKDVEEKLGSGCEQQIKKPKDPITGDEDVVNLVYYKNTQMSMVLEYEHYDGHERLMGIYLVKNIDKRDT